MTIVIDRPGTSVDELRAACRQVEPGSFLALLSAEDRSALGACGAVCRYEPGERLMHRGEPAESVMVLLSGRVKVGRVDSRGCEVVLGFRGPGDLLGERTSILGPSRASDVAALEPVTVHRVAVSAFDALLLRRPSVALTLVDVLGGRLRDADDKLTEHGELGTSGRIAARLLELCDRYGEVTEAGTAIQLALTQEDLRGWTASSRAGVASALRTMRQCGWIATQRRRIVVLDRDALTRLAA